MIGAKGGVREVDVHHKCAAGKTGSMYNGESSLICSVLLIRNITVCIIITALILY
jgi:hypothetical protein